VHNMDELTFRQLKDSKYYHPILTEVMFDYNMMLDMIHDSISITEKGYDAVIDSSMLNFTISNFKEGMDLIAKRAQDKGIRVRAIFDVNKDNLNIIMKIKHHEIKHIDGLKGNFAIFDNRAYMVFIFQKGSERPDQTLWSNSKELVQKQQEIFNKLWDLAIPLSVRRKEIELEDNTTLFQRAFTGMDQIQSEIKSLIFLCKSELIIFSSINILNNIQNNSNLINHCPELLERGIVIKILTDHADKHFIDRIDAINNKSPSKPIQLKYSNNIGNLKEMVMIFDNRHLLIIQYNRQKKLVASFSNEDYTVLIQEILFEKHWNEVESLSSMPSLK
jgi:hypothetical protein